VEEVVATEDVKLPADAKVIYIIMKESFHLLMKRQYSA
jgi:hypothetical protein